MKNVLLITVFFILSTGSIKAQSGCAIPPVLNTFYKDDIGALAVKLALATADSDKIEIPPVYYNEVASGMAAIFNSAIPAGDSVFNMYCIHWPWGVSVYKGWMIGYDSSYSWTSAWQHTQTVTGDPYIDSLFARHQLTVTHNYVSGMGTFVTVTGAHALNYDALIDSLLLKPGILWAESNQVIGTAGYLNYYKTGNTKHYEFTFEWNDCFDGCDNSHTWKFDVDSNCNATFTGTSDWWAIAYEPLPLSPGNCFAPTSVPAPHENKNDFEMYPNPFSDQLHIRLLQPGNAALRIRDVLGKTIVSRQISSMSSVIDLRNYPGGIYFLDLIINGERISKKVIKE